MLMDARDKETGEAMTRSRADRRSDDARGRRATRPPRADSTGRGTCCRSIPKSMRAARRDRRGAPSRSRPASRTWRRSPTRIRSSMRRCACIRPGWLLSRRTIAADTLGGLRPYRAGTDVLLRPYLLHRHPPYWKEPDSFRPERFDAEHEAERPRFAYMPFAAGPAPLHRGNLRALRNADASV